MLYCPSLKWALLLWRARGLTYWRRVYPVYQPSARPLYRDGGVKAENNGCHHYRGPGLRPSQGHKRYPTVTPRRASHHGCVRRRCGCRTNIHGPRNAGRYGRNTKRPLLRQLALPAAIPPTPVPPTPVPTPRPTYCDLFPIDPSCQRPPAPAPAPAPVPVPPVVCASCCCAGADYCARPHAYNETSQAPKQTSPHEHPNTHAHANTAANADASPFPSMPRCWSGC